MNKGLLENSNVSQDGYVLKGDNLSIDGGTIGIRKGMTIHGICAKEGDQTITQQMPYKIKTVSISGEDVVFMVTASGDLVGILPTRVTKFYPVYRRVFEVVEKVELFNINTIFSTVDIYEVGNFIYVISNCRSWVIRKDGILSFSDDIITVDAEEATIYDIDTTTLYAKGVGRFCANILEDTELYARFRSEFGGRGRPTFPINTKTMESYVCEVGEDINGRMFGNDGCAEIAYKTIVYASNVDNQVKEDAADERTDTELKGNTEQIVLHKNIQGYGVLCWYETGATDITIGVHGVKGVDDESFPVGKVCGLTLPTGTYAVGTKSWADATVVATPAAYSLDDKTCVFFSVPITTPVFGFCPNTITGPIQNVILKQFYYDLEDIVVGSAGEGETLTLTLNLASVFNTIDGRAYMTVAASADAGDKDIEDITMYEALKLITDGTTSTCTVIPELSRTLCNVPVMLYKNSETGADAHYGAYGWNNYEASAAEYGEIGGVSVRPFLHFINDTAGELSGNILTVNMKTSMQYSSYADGCSMRIYNGTPKANTWFKDRAFSPKFYVIDFYDSEVEPVQHFALAPLVVISDQHDIAHTNDEDGTYCDFIMTPPSDNSGGNFPVKANLWNDCKYNSTGDYKTKLYYNPRAWVNVNGDVIIQTSTTVDNGDTASIKIFDKSLVAIYKTIAVPDKDIFKNGYNEIYATRKGDIPVKIGEEYNLFRTYLDLEYAYQKRLSQYAANTAYAASSKYGMKHYPILLSNIGISAATEINKYSQSVGEFVSTCYFNGRFYFASANVVKETNMLLEYDPVNTFPVTGLITGLVALANQMYIFTYEGIYTFNSSKEIEKFSNAKASAWCVVGERLYFADTDGYIYHTEFTPVPVGQQKKNTNNPYIIKVEDSSAITEAADQWTIYSLASASNKLYVSTSKGTYVLDTDTNVWFRHVYPYTPILMTEYKNKIFSVGGNYVDDLYILDVPFDNIPLYQILHLPH